MKEIHFYENDSTSPSNVVHGWVETSVLIEIGDERIHTTQMGLLSTRLIEAGYKIIVHEPDGVSYEIKLGGNERTEKEIRPAHNLFKMWEAGAFSRN